MKALCVFSGGLDSMLAAGIIRAQGIDVLGLFFETPFFSPRKARESAKSMGLPFKVINITERHLDVVKSPKHGYGGNMNPCIDCHALMFRVAGELLEKEGASFVLTGEVLGQRPMSQNKQSLALVASESGIEGLLLRPLSARHLPPTIPEKNQWVKRDMLINFQGRSRKPQMALALKMGIKKYPAPGGGCLLTEEVFSRRLKDLFTCRINPEIREIELLKFGRHFRLGPNTKLVVGRNKSENDIIDSLTGDKDLILTSVSVPGPTVLVSGDPSNDSLHLAAEFTAAYSDTSENGSTQIQVAGLTEHKILVTEVPEKEKLKKYMI